MEINYDWPDMPIGTPMSFGGLLILNGKDKELTEEEEAMFERTTGLTLHKAARNTPQLTIKRKKVSN